MSCARSHIISQDKTSRISNWMKQEMQTGPCQEAGAFTLINNLITYDSMFELQHEGEVKGTAWDWAAVCHWRISAFIQNPHSLPFTLHWPPVTSAWTQGWNKMKNTSWEGIKRIRGQISICEKGCIMIASRKNGKGSWAGSMVQLLVITIQAVIRSSDCHAHTENDLLCSDLETEATSTLRQQLRLAQGPVINHMWNECTLHNRQSAWCYSHLERKLMIIHESTWATMRLVSSLPT